MSSFFIALEKVFQMLDPNVRYMWVILSKLSCSAFLIKLSTLKLMYTAIGKSTENWLPRLQNETEVIILTQI